jgi:hypothetical protein
LSSVICFWHFVTSWLLTVRSWWPLANIQSGELPFIGCMPLLIRFIGSYQAYLEAVFFHTEPEACSFMFR